MPDIDGLTTRLPRDKHYSDESPTKGGLPGFVCPRADAYGGRDGIIPPGVAAVNGLVPKGMRHISTADTAKKADAARYDGRTEAERYREYYEAAVPKGRPESRPVSQPEPRQAPKPVRRAPIRPPRVIPAVSVRPPKVGGRLLPGAGVRIARTYPPGDERLVIKDPDDPGMFSRELRPGPDEDTLDGFYDGLSGEAPGTGERDMREPKRGFAAGVDMAAGPSEAAVGVAYPGIPRTHEPLGSGTTESAAMANALAKLAEDKYTLTQQVLFYESRVAELEQTLGELARERADAAERDKHYMRTVEEELRKASAPAETVRVALAIDEERLKVGGERWECKVVGSLHVGRQGRSAVLSVSDPAYSADLLAEIKQGRVVILSGEKRTYCTYDGHCAKIYAEPGSQDFIALFWLSIDGSDAA